MNWNRDRERKAARAMGIGISIFAIVFAVVWCILAVSIGAGFMLLFGIPFVAILIFWLVNLLRMTKKDPRPTQESDPWDTTWSAMKEEFQDAARQQPRDPDARKRSQKFCHHCSFWLQDGFEFCPKCGRRIF